MWRWNKFSADLKTYTVALCAALVLLTFNDWHVTLRRPLEPTHTSLGAILLVGITPQLPQTPRHTSTEITTDARDTEIALVRLSAIRNRWDAMWSTDVSAADTNIVNLHAAASLIARAERGDLEATADLIGAATWCLAGGSLVNVTELIDNERRPCFEHFGTHLASRERLERASFEWVLQLSAAGIDDATLYASALIRGNVTSVLGGVDLNEETRETQRELLLGKLQTLVDRGSADAASELHGHWSGSSAFRLNDDRRANYYAALTEKLDPLRSIATAPQ
jgi:hypothetical protein